MAPQLRAPAFAAIVLAVSGATAWAAEVIVKTPLGELAGVDGGKFHAFKGIRYAETPGRWEQATPKKPWSGVVNATSFGDACACEHAWAGLYGSSEDCLYANVYTPLLAWRLPVVVFFHGGGFMEGTGNKPTYWGDLFTTQGLTDRVVLVTFNYRLGIFGFLSDSQAGANFAIHDQQLLLGWVQQNIASFGGDPSQVMVVGQSAGAMSILTHIVSPGSKGLFQRAFVASAVGLHYRSLAENDKFVSSVALTLGCPPGDSPRRLACLRSKPVAEIARAGTWDGYLFHLIGPCEGCDNFLPWLPVVDGTILPNHPVTLIRDGQYANVPLVLSTVRNESLAFVPGIAHEAVDIKEAYWLVMSVLFKGRASAVEAHYAKQPDSAAMDLFSRIGLTVTDALFTCYARYLAKLFTGTGNPTHLSTFMIAPSAHADPGNSKVNPQCSHGATCHGGNLVFMFPQTEEVQKLMNTSFTPDEVKEAEAYSEAVRSFAHGRQGFWIPYNTKDDRSLGWNSATPETLIGYHKDHCDFLESINFTDPWTSTVKTVPSTAVIV